MPPVLYSENFTLYASRIGCTSLLNNCSAQGQPVVESLYSLPIAVWSPDGYQVAVHLSDQWGIFEADCLLNNADCQPRLLDASVNDTRLAWGPSGSVIAFMDDNGTLLHILTRGCWDGSAGRCLRERVVMSESGRVGQIDWSGNGQRMVFVDGQAASLALYDMACLDDAAGCAAYRQTFRPKQVPIAWPSLSPDGRQVLYQADSSGVGIDEQLFILDVPSGKIRQITFRGGASLHADWSADGRYITYVGFATPESGDLDLYVMDLERGLTIRLLHHLGQHMDYPAWGIIPESRK